MIHERPSPNTPATAGVCSLVMPSLHPGSDRREAVFPEGTPIASIVDTVLPGLPRERHSAVRVIVVGPSGADVVPQEAWASVRPKVGTRVLVRVVPGNGLLRGVLQIVAMIAAVALAGVLGPMLAGVWGLSAATWQGIVTAGVALAGNLLINALIPVRKPEKEAKTFQIGGMRNQANPDGPIPNPFGRMRMAPVYWGLPYTEVVGDIQYLRVLFVWGYGRLKISDLKIGETPLSEFDEVEIETREGVDDDDPVTLYPQQVLEEALSVELTRAWERDDAGEYVSGGTTIEKPVVRVTASDASEAGVILAFPAGLTRMNDEGQPRNRTVEVRIRQRPVGEETWSLVRTLKITAAKSEPLLRAHRWALPGRGAYEVELTRITDESKKSTTSDRVMWQALQSFRPEYPINFDKPLAISALRIKATYQLNGQIDALNGIVERIAPDWDGATETWIERETRSPAAALRYALQGPATAYPEADEAIDLDQLADWAEFCAAHGLKYDRVHDFDQSLREALLDITAAGRATPRHDGKRWGVVIDRPQSLVVDHINPRNSRNFRWVRNYLRAPDGFRIAFQDQTNDYQRGERIVPWPGHVGDVVITEQIDLPGKTDPGEIWVEARRRMYELLHRPDQLQVTQDGRARRATRGDLVALSYDVLSRVQKAALVKRVTGTLVVFDDAVTIEPDTTYGIRFRVFSGPDDGIGQSVVRPVIAGELGQRMAVRLGAGDDAPAAGDVVHFGPIASESLLCVVRGEERGEGNAVILTLVEAAPIIDQLTDAETPPPWDGRVGSPIGSPSAVPAAPVFTAIVSGVEATEDPNGLIIALVPGPGSPAVVGSFEIGHRLVGAPGWTAAEVLLAEGAVRISSYTAGDSIEVRARAVSIYSVAGPYAGPVPHVIGSNDPVVPQPLAFAAEQLPSGFWRFSWTLAPADTVTSVLGVRIRGKAGDWPNWADLDPLQVGLLTSSPWETTGPTADDVYTFGIVAVSSGGFESEPLLITQSSAAVDILGTGDGDVLDTGDGSFLSPS
jgi:hypothetical protein